MWTRLRHPNHRIPGDPVFPKACRRPKRSRLRRPAETDRRSPGGSWIHFLATVTALGTRRIPERRGMSGLARERSATRSRAPAAPQAGRGGRHSAYRSCKLVHGCSLAWPFCANFSPVRPFSANDNANNTRIVWNHSPLEGRQDGRWAENLRPVRGDGRLLRVWRRWGVHPVQRPRGLSFMRRSWRMPGIRRHGNKRGKQWDGRLSWVCGPANQH